MERWPASVGDFRDRSPAVTVLGGLTLLFTVAVRVAELYVPQYLNLLGASAASLGGYAALALLVEAVPSLSAERRGVDSVAALLAAGCAATLGAFLWLFAGAAGAVLGVSGVVVATAGSLLARTWGTHGPGALFDDALVDAEHARVTETLTEVGALKQAGLLAVLAPTAALFTAVSPFVTAFSVYAAVVAALGATATVALAVLGGSGDVETPAVDRPRPELGGVRAALDDLTVPLWRGVAAGGLVAAAEGMVSAFLVIVVVEYHAVGLATPLVDVPPTAFFGVLVAAETTAALASLAFGSRLVRAAGTVPVVAAGAAATAAFPAALVLAPSNPPLLLALFTAYGARFVGRPARDALFAGRLRAALGDDESVRDALRASRLVRRGAAVPAAFAAGVLYGASPLAAFGLASLVGAAGLWLYVRFVRAE